MQNNLGRLGVAVAVAWLFATVAECSAGDRWTVSVADKAPVFWHFAEGAGRDGKLPFTIATTAAVEPSDRLGNGMLQKFKKNIMARIQWDNGDACEYFGVLEGDTLKGRYTCERSGPLESEWSAVIAKP
jgi:hypothetical protein